MISGSYVCQEADSVLEVPDLGWKRLSLSHKARVCPFDLTLQIDSSNFYSLSHLQRGEKSYNFRRRNGHAVLTGRDMR